MEGDDHLCKPAARGGSIEYVVDVSSVDCGCVAGLYLVASDESSCKSGVLETDEPTCPTIDVMNANRYGFSTEANCANGECDAVTQRRSYLIQSQLLGSKQSKSTERGHTDQLGPILTLTSPFTS